MGIATDTLIETDHLSPCIICMTETFLVDADFCANCCSQDCLDQLWGEYEQAEAEAGPVIYGWDVT